MTLVLTNSKHSEKGNIVHEPGVNVMLQSPLKNETDRIHDTAGNVKHVDKAFYIRT